MRLKTKLWLPIIFSLLNRVAGQDINVVQDTSSSPYNYDTGYNSPQSTINPNLDINQYNPYSTQDPRFGSPYGQNDPYATRDPYGPVGKDDPYGSKERGEYGPYDNDQFGNRGRTQWRNNVFGGGRTQLDSHSTIIREA